MKLPRHIYVVGAGGVTTYFLPCFLKTLANHSEKIKPYVHIIDGDKVELRNLERQLFDPGDVGENKADALVSLYESEYTKLVAEPRFFNPGSRFIDDSLVFGFVDNHPARRAILASCDASHSNAILAANEYTDAQAMWYTPEMCVGPYDPRVRYPEILEDDADDPLSPRGCLTAEALKAAPQLGIANLACASYALQIFWFYYVVKDTLNPVETKPYWPIEHSSNFNRLTTHMERNYGNRQPVESR